ncbi:MAG TPA: TadE family protein [Acidimicrobiia bacterium]|nr:TadE family protein [Acidimicrobiia bacterium]
MNFKRIGRNKERGATLVEAAVALPILLLVVVAILELGLVFKDYLTVSYLSREGARIGALAGNDEGADCAILLGIEDLATSTDLARMSEIEIYRASPSGTVLQGPNTGVYVGGDPPQCTTPTPDVNDTWTVNSSPWPTSDREVSVGPTVSPDIIGVRIQLQHDWITGLPPFNGTINIDERTITRMEPKAFYPGS